MPRVAADVTSSKRFELQSAPPDGFIVIRKLSYGETLESQKIGAKGVREGSGMTLRTDLLAVRHFTFSKMILDHNLEDADGNKMDFSRLADVARLIPAVGEEMEDICEAYNGSDAEGNLPTKSEKPSSPVPLEIPSSADTSA